MVQIDPPVSGRVQPQAVSLSAGKIYFAGNSGNTPVIGSSSLTFTDFTAKEYVRGHFNNENLTLLEDGRLAFVGLETNSTTSQLVLLNSNLNQNGVCDRFGRTRREGEESHRRKSEKPAM